MYRDSNSDPPPESYLEDEVEIQVHESLVRDKKTFIEGQRILLKLELMYKVQKISRSITAWLDGEMMAVQLHYPPRAQSAQLGESYGVPICVVFNKRREAIGGLYWLSMHHARDIEHASKWGSARVDFQSHYKAIHELVREAMDPAHESVSHVT